MVHRSRCGRDVVASHSGKSPLVVNIKSDATNWCLCGDSQNSRLQGSMPTLGGPVGAQRCSHSDPSTTPEQTQTSC